MAESLSGGCYCGQVRFSLTSEPMAVQACHCNACRRASSAPFVVNMFIEADRVVINGETQQYCATGGSGKPLDIFFCKACGTTLWSKYYAAPDNALFVRAACLDNPELAPPQFHIYTQSKLSWVTIPDELPQFDGFYNPFKVWSEASVERFKAIM